MSTTTAARPVVHSDLSLTRLHLMRAGYLLMGIGLALVKWPLLPDAASLPLYEGVTRTRYRRPVAMTLVPDQASDRSSRLTHHSRSR
jgi:hypothetical protein